jgi:hypothetical protein
MVETVVNDMVSIGCAGRRGYGRFILADEMAGAMGQRFRQGMNR